MRLKNKRKRRKAWPTSIFLRTFRSRRTWCLWPWAGFYRDASQHRWCSWSKSWGWSRLGGTQADRWAACWGVVTVSKTRQTGPITPNFFSFLSSSYSSTFLKIIFLIFFPGATFNYIIKTIWWSFAQFIFQDCKNNKNRYIFDLLVLFLLHFAKFLIMILWVTSLKTLISAGVYVSGVEAPIGVQMDPTVGLGQPQQQHQLHLLKLRPSKPFFLNREP